MIGIKKFSIKNMNIDINRGELIGVVGPNGSGKTHLLEMIIGRHNNREIYIDDKKITKYSIDYKRKNIVAVFNDDDFYTSSPKDEIRYFLNKVNYNNNDIDSKVVDFINYFNIGEILNKDYSDIDYEEKIYIKILSYLIINPSVFCLDDLLTFLSNERQKRILNYVKDKKIMLISSISNTNELKYYDKLIVLNKGRCIKYDTVSKILSNEQLFNELGLSIPFIYDINSMLKNYGLINESHLIEKDLVDILWK